MLEHMKNIALSMAGLVSTMGSAAAQNSIEQPQYEIIKEIDGVELRSYAPYLVAEVTVKANSMREASSRGFRPLANYIFGGNQGADKIAMTAPVTTQPQQDATKEGTQIAMTAPVTTREAEEGLYNVRFSMPSQWTMETLPKPNDPNVKLIQVAGEQRLAYRFVGPRSDARIDEALRKIDAFMTEENISTASPMMIAGYDGPSVPEAKKRWEVMRVLPQ